MERARCRHRAPAAYPCRTGPRASGDCRPRPRGRRGEGQGWGGGPSRQKGILPRDTAEGIWRVIISTFTYVQAPFSVHADLSAGDATMRDSARFHFGFTVPFVPHMGAASVVAAVSDSKGDLGLLPAFSMAGAGASGSALEFATGPKVIARLPSVERADHPAGVPVFVVSRAAA